TPPDLHRRVKSPALLVRGTSRLPDHPSDSPLRESARLVSDEVQIPRFADGQLSSLKHLMDLRCYLVRRQSSQLLDQSIQLIRVEHRLPVLHHTTPETGSRRRSAHFTEGFFGIIANEFDLVAPDVPDVDSQAHRRILFFSLRDRIHGDHVAPFAADQHDSTGGSRTLLHRRDAYVGDSAIEDALVLIIRVGTGHLGLKTFLEYMFQLVIRQVVPEEPLGVVGHSAAREVIIPEIVDGRSSSSKNSKPHGSGQGTPPFA
ncbi:hypothetical protein AB0C61_20215, partial [Streptomyces sp. NPDC048680]|uniref:hypothetical protein n=1 Tax=Streptomyces sp. NPDC048680 TaxID=3155492 RepID=UPI0034245A8B